MTTPYSWSGIQPTDTELLDAMANGNWSVDAPEPPDSRTWIVYDKDSAFGDGIACMRDLRQALTIAFLKTKGQI